MSLPNLQCPWCHIILDFVTDLPEFLSNTMNLVVPYQFSHSLHLIPLAVLPQILRQLS